MGGRGGYSGGFAYETNRRRRGLQSEYDELDERIRSIDEAADAAGRKYADERRNAGYPSWSDPEEEYADDYEDGRRDYIERTERAELARKRRKVKWELDALKAGQRTLL